MSRLRQYLTRILQVPGTWESENQKAQAEALHASQIVIGAVGLMFVILSPNVLYGSPLISAAVLLYAVVGSILLRLGHLRTAGIWSTVVLGLLNTVRMYNDGGITPGPYAAFLMLVVLVGMVYGLGPSLAAGIAGIIVGVTVGYIGHAGLLPPPSQPYTPLSPLPEFIISLIVVAFFTGVLLRRIRSTNERTQRELAERVRIEQAGRISQERFRALSEATFEGIAITDANGIVDANERLAAMLDVRLDELQGKDLGGFVSGDDRERVEQAITRAEPEPFEHRFVRRDGTHLPVESRVRSFEYQGRTVRLIAIRDLSEKVEGESRRQLLEEQLLHVQKTEAVGRLAGGIAHDFNNLLNVILGYAEMMLEKTPPEDPNTPKILQIRKAGERAATLTRQLLAYSRRQTLTMQTLDLKGLVTDLVQMLSRLLGEDIPIETDLPGTLWGITGDESQIEQVVINVALNCRDAMPGGGRLSLCGRNVSIEPPSSPEFPFLSAGDYVCLSITDTGQGMDESVRRRAFEPFFTTKPFGKGTGLGLSTAYGIVRQHEGNMYIESKVGEGTTMHILLPRAKDDWRTQNVRPAVQEEFATVSKGTILFVEDEEGVREFVQEALRTRGYTVLAASGPSEAIRLIDLCIDKPTVLLTDVIMPEMHGAALYEQLRLKVPKLRVLFISGYSNDILAERGVLKKGTELLQKPFTVSALVARVEALFRPAL
jgi:two-component system, cell cycle sensor histidine kinase and response regulator CckA